MARVPGSGVPYGISRLAASSGRPVVMDGNEFSAGGKAMDIHYRLLGE